MQFYPLLSLLKTICDIVSSCLLTNLCTLLYSLPSADRYTVHRKQMTSSIYKYVQCKIYMGLHKEVDKEQPSYINLSATATRVPQCTCPVAASWKYFSAVHTTTSPHLNSLTLTFVKNIILHLLLVLCTAVNVRNKNYCV